MKREATVHSLDRAAQWRGSAAAIAGVAGLLCACGGAAEPSDTESIHQHSQALTSTWTPFNQAAPAFFDNCLLLTTGDVMCHEYNSNRWHRLRPDAFGSYANGTWDSPPIPPMPNGNDPNFGCVNCTYAPLYFASAVLPNGRVIVIGGEYVNLNPVWTTIGFVYDPLNNLWSSQVTQSFGIVGDASGIVLADGSYVLSDILSGDLEGFDVETLAFTARHPPGKLDINNEENWNILYDGSVLAVDSRIPTSFERYSPATNSWGNSGSTGVNLADTGPDVGFSSEVGPCVLRPDSRLLCFSGNSLGQNALYNTATNTWSHTANMDFPLVPGATFHYAVADGPASILPNGNVLVMASPVANGSPFNSPSHFYEVDLATNTLSAVTDTPNAPFFAAYQGRMLSLPSGQVLLAAFNQGATQDLLLYSNGGAPLDAWRPSITSFPAVVSAGTTYTIAGRLFNGFSEGATYGDDAQMSSNYPLVRITNTSTGHVAYARTHGHSRMGVEPVGSTEIVTTQFDAPAGLESGPSTLVVVVNGIPSAPVAINGSGNNQPPVARCHNVAVDAGAGCVAAVSASAVDAGSFDPDGGAVSCALSPSGPFAVGATSVTLTCTDAAGATASCNAQVAVGVGNNAACCPAGTHVVLGTSNADVLNGTAGPDCILGFGSNDTINGLGGNDIISAGDGDDVVSGGPGDDLIFGGSGQDRLSGDAGNDVIAGGDGDDQCFGGDGDDRISGGQGQDRLFGDAGNDQLSGDDGDDRLEGGAGDDILDGGGLHDMCIGGPGNDSFLMCESQVQ